MRIATLLLSALICACPSSTPQGCLTHAECDEGLCVDGLCQDPGPADTGNASDTGNGADVAGGRDASGMDVAVVDASTALDGGTDAPVDAPPDGSLRRDVGPLPTYTRSDSAEASPRSGQPVEMGAYIAWMGQNASAVVHWFDRTAGTIDSRTVSSQYTQRSSAVSLDGDLWIAWERTEGGGAPGGVSLANLGAAPSAARPAIIDVEGALGFPQLIVVDGTLIVVAETSSLRQIAAFVIDDQAVSRTEALPGEVLSGAVATEDGFVYANASNVRLVNTTTWAIGDAISVGGPTTALALHSDRIIAGFSAGGLAFVRSYTMEGAMVAEREIPVMTPANDPRVASDGRVILAAGRIPGGAMLLDENLDLVLDLGMIQSNPWLGVTATGFVSVAQGASLAFIEFE